MHLTILTRGILHEQQRFINNLSSMVLPWNVPKGKFKGQHNLQVGVRPINLYEVAFPEPCLQNMMRTLWDAQPSEEKFKVPRTMIRKMMGLKKIPPIDFKAKYLPVHKAHVTIYPIGYKEDTYDEKTGAENI